MAWHSGMLWTKRWKGLKGGYLIEKFCMNTSLNIGTTENQTQRSGSNWLPKPRFALALPGGGGNFLWSAIPSTTPALAPLTSQKCYKSTHPTITHLTSVVRVTKRFTTSVWPPTKEAAFAGGTALPWWFHRVPTWWLLTRPLSTANITPLVNKNAENKIFLNCVFFSVSSARQDCSENSFTE